MNKFIMLPDLDSGIIYNINVDHISCYHSAGVNERDGVCVILISGKEVMINSTLLDLENKLKKALES